MMSTPIVLATFLASVGAKGIPTLTSTTAPLGTFARNLEKAIPATERRSARRLQSANDFAYLHTAKEFLCASPGVISEVLGSDPQTAQLATYGADIETCICESDTSLLLGLASTNESGVEGAFSLMCSSAACKRGLLELGIAANPESSINAKDATTCMCEELTVFAELTTGSQVTQAQMLTLMGTPSCNSLMQAGVDQLVVANGVTKATDCDSDASTQCSTRCTQCMVATVGGTLGVDTSDAQDANGDSCDSCIPCLPYADCLLGKAGEVVEAVKVSVKAAGDIADYDDAKKSTLEANMANTLGVPAQDVTVTVSSASVVLDFTIKVTTPAAATLVDSKVKTTMASPAATTAALGGSSVVTVEQVPTVETVKGKSGGDNTALIIGCAAGGGGFVLIVLVLVACYCSKKKKAAAPSKSTSSASTSSASV